jgi:hypothetical protein
MVGLKQLPQHSPSLVCDIAIEFQIRPEKHYLMAGEADECPNDLFAHMPLETVIWMEAPTHFGAPVGLERLAVTEEVGQPCGMRVCGRQRLFIEGEPVKVDCLLGLEFLLVELQCEHLVREPLEEAEKLNPLELGDKESKVGEFGTRFPRLI